MAHEELQVESGNYTRIVNKVIEQLVNTPLLGAEYAVCLFIIRKTYGFNKKQDEISITQFEKGTGRSRPTIVKALRNLQLVNIVQLVKKGDSKIHSNLWAFNKYYETWNLVKGRKLVKKKRSTSKEIKRQLVKGGKHTKDNTKETKDSTAQSADAANPVISLFKELNPSYERLFSRPPQRAAAVRLLELHGLDRLGKVIGFVGNYRTDRYCPTITTPIQLEDKWAALEGFAAKLKSVKKTIVV